MAYEHILYEVRDGVAIVTLNRPKVLNALNSALLGELEQAFTAIRDDAAVGAALPVVWNCKTTCPLSAGSSKTNSCFVVVPATPLVYGVSERAIRLLNMSYVYVTCSVSTPALV